MSENILRATYRPVILHVEKYADQINATALVRETAIRTAKRLYEKGTSAWECCSIARQILEKNTPLDGEPT